MEPFMPYREDLVKMVQENADDINSQSPKISVMDEIKYAYRKPEILEEPSQFLHFIIDNPKVFLMDMRGGKNRWNTGNCIDDEM